MRGCSTSTTLLLVEPELCYLGQSQQEVFKIHVRLVLVYSAKYQVHLFTIHQLRCAVAATIGRRVVSCDLCVNHHFVEL